MPPEPRAVMTAAERLRRQGREEGRRQGREEGSEEGRKECAREYLSMLLQVRFGELPEANLAAIGAAEKPQLDRWFERGLEAHALDDVFGSVP